MNEPKSPFKGTMMLRDTRERPYGWTESLWINKPSFKESLAALEDIAASRLMLLPQGFSIQRLKATHPSVPRASAENYHYRQAGKNTGDGHSATILLVLRLESNDRSTTYQLGGVPKDVANSAGVHPPEDWQRSFEQFAEKIKCQCVMLNQRQTEKVPILSITQSAGQQVHIATAVDFFNDAHIAIKNGCFSQVRLSGLSQQALNDTHTIQIVDAKTAILTNNLLVEPNITGGFLVSMGIKQANPIESVIIVKQSRRKRGYGHSYPRRGRARRRPT